MRGGEKVLSGLCRLIPQADLLTLLHVPGSSDRHIERMRIRTSVLNDLPGAPRYYRHLLPVMPLAMEALDARDYDLIISSSHCVAKGVIRSPGARHICYCHTPMRYLWAQGRAYGRSMGVSGWALRLMRPYLRAWDRRSATHVDTFVANSRNVADRIDRIYGRRASVIYPPVDTAFFTPADVAREPFYLVAGAMSPYKRVDQAISACRRLGRELVVIGGGQHRGKLARTAPPNVTFLGPVSDETIRDHYRRAQALLYPGEEDFGIVPVEAMACGCPVIAYGAGGALETVVDVGSADSAAPTGLLYAFQTLDGLASAIERFEACRHQFDPAAMARWADRFSEDRFMAETRQLLAASLPGVALAAP